MINQHFRLVEQNSYEAYKEERLIDAIEKVVSEHSAIDRKNVKRTGRSLSIPTKLNIGHISRQGLINSLAKHGNAKVEVEPDGEVYIICAKPKTYPAYIYGTAVIGYGVWSLLAYHFFLRGLIYAFF
jgi:hypothetical protein